MPEAFYFWIRNWYATLISNDGKSTENKYKTIPKWSFKMRSNERKESCGRCLLHVAACFLPFQYSINLLFLFLFFWMKHFYHECFSFEKHLGRRFISMKGDDLNSVVFKKSIKFIRVSVQCSQLFSVCDMFHVFSF